MERLKWATALRAAFGPKMVFRCSTKEFGSTNLPKRKRSRAVADCRHKAMFGTCGHHAWSHALTTGVCGLLHKPMTPWTDALWKRRQLVQTEAEEWLRQKVDGCAKPLIDLAPNSHGNQPGRGSTFQDQG